MRICHLSSTSLEGHYFRDLVLGQQQRGHTLICGTLADIPCPSWAVRHGIPYFALGATSRAGYIAAAFRLSVRLRRNRVDVLHLHLFDAGIVGCIANLAAQVPVVVIGRHHLAGNTLYGRRLHVELDRYMAKIAGRVMVASNAVHDHMRENEKLPNVEIVTNNYGFDFAELRAGANGPDVRAEFGISPSAPVIGIVGRIVPPKGHDLLVSAISSLRPDFPDMALFIVGSGDTAWVRAAMLDAGLSDGVFFAGYRDDVAACIATCDVLAHPTRDEAFGNVLVEAMAIGVPTVAASVGGVPEIVDHGRTGLLVEPDDSEALAAAIRSLLRDRKLASQLSSAARQSVEAQFSVDRMVEKTLDTYKLWLDDARCK